MAWQAHHPTDQQVPGSDCARCACAAATTKVSEVVSRKFTAWDTWADPASPRLCSACTWGYRTTQLRAETFLVTRPPRGPGCQPLTPPDLLEVLLEGPVPSDCLISLPLRAGRRHVLPTARFGQVCLDGTNLSWSTGDARRLQLVAHLRSEGVPWTAFTEPAPPWRALRQCNDPNQMLHSWDELAAWRQSGLWLQTALAATHPAGSSRAA